MFCHLFAALKDDLRCAFLKVEHLNATNKQAICAEIVHLAEEKNINILDLGRSHVERSSVGGGVCFFETVVLQWHCAWTLDEIGSWCATHSGGMFR